MANVPVLNVIADVAQLVRNAPNPTLIAAYVRAARKFCRESRWLRVELLGQAEADTRVYSLGSDPYLEVLGLRAASAARTSGNTKRWPLTVSATDGWDPNAGPGKPQRYAYVPEAQVAIDPVPDGAYDLTLTLVVQPKAGVNELPEELLVKWDQVLQAGALAYLFAIPGQTWTDLAESKRQAAVLQSGINNARADEQREFNAGTTFIKRRRFLAGGRP
ncbi:MAG: hypothetical protein KF863_21415 [Rubrivivax sp.]|nr:hypothetical protein [Rubrivivax sp.]